MAKNRWKNARIRQLFNARRIPSTQTKMTSKIKTQISTTSEQETETRYLIPNFFTYLTAIDAERAKLNGKKKANSPLGKFPPKWKIFFTEFTDKGSRLYESSIKAMIDGVGVKDQTKAQTLLAALNNAIVKFNINMPSPTIIKITSKVIVVVGKQK
jgi:hypothetical protein